MKTMKQNILPLLQETKQWNFCYYFEIETSVLLFLLLHSVTFEGFGWKGAKEKTIFASDWDKEK